MSCPTVIDAPYTLKELVTAFRQEADDLPADGTTNTNWENDDTGLLWSNAEIVGYANQAEIELARRKPIRDDNTSAITTLTVSSGTTRVPYSSKILSIRRVRYTEDASGDSLTLTKVTHQQLDAESDDWATDTGRPECYYENGDERTIVLDRIPDVDGTLALIVDRLPETSMRWAYRHTDTPQVAHEHHQDLVYYMLHRAYLKRDSETYNEESSRQYLGMFTSRVGPRASSHLEKVRREERNIKRRVKPHYF